MANPGDFRHLCSVYAPVQGASDGAGGYAAADAELVTTVWASLEQLGGSEQPRGMQIVATATHRIGLRERIDGLDASMWLVLEGRTFHIVAPPNDPGEMRREMVLLVREDM